MTRLDRLVRDIAHAVIYYGLVEPRDSPVTLVIDERKP